LKETLLPRRRGFFEEEVFQVVFKMTQLAQLLYFGKEGDYPPPLRSN
jgi:hypothetical protein